MLPFSTLAALHGLRISDGAWQAAASNVHLYNQDPPLEDGKELQDELGLGWYNYGARMFSSTVGRWNGVDALAGDYLAWSPFNYTMGNPIRFIDPDGNGVNDYYIYEDGTIEYVDTGDQDSYFYVSEDENRAYHLTTLERNENGLVYLSSELCVSYCNMSDDGVEFTIRQKPNGAEDEMYVRPDAMASLLGAAVELNSTEMVVNHFSNADGTSPSPSSSHVDGKNGDIRYLRKDHDWNQAVTVFDDQFDRDANTQAAAAFKKYGWSSILSYKAGDDWIVPGTTHYTNHHHHFHLQGYSPKLKNVSFPSFLKK